MYVCCNAHCMILAWVDQSWNAKSNGAFLIRSFIDHRPKHGYYRQPCSMADKTWHGGYFFRLWHEL